MWKGRDKGERERERGKLNMYRESSVTKETNERRGKERDSETGVVERESENDDLDTSKLFENLRGKARDCVELSRSSVERNQRKGMTKGLRNGK